MPTVLVLVGVAVATVTSCSDAGDGELVLFAALGPGGGQVRYQAAGVELTATQGYDALGLSAPGAVSGAPELPEPAAGVRRFGFVLAGCQETSARLSIAGGAASAELDEDGPEVDCARAEWFLAVFDVPADQVPEGTRVS